MFTDVDEKIRKKNKILFTRESEFLRDLRALICRQTRLALVLWAFDCMQFPLSELMSRYPGETDIQSAYELSLLWAHGEIKMPAAKKAILSCHAAAERLDNAYDVALCHAVGQGCSTVHTETHALGLVFYELTAVVIKCGYADYQDKVIEKINFYTEKLKMWQEKAPSYRKNEKWADFLTVQDKVNREKLRDLKLKAD